MSETQALDKLLEQGRGAYAKRSWKAAYAALSRADRDGSLGPQDLELLAVSAYMLGRADEWETVLGRAQQLATDIDDTPRAIRHAFWIGMENAVRGNMGPASGWFARLQRLIEREEAESAMHGYTLLPRALERQRAGEAAEALELARRAAMLGERFGNPELFALGTFLQGQVLIADGRLQEGLTLLDEAMVASTSGDPSPMVTGVVYCGVILACVGVYDVRRAQEWTEVLRRWCEEQTDLVAYTGRCLVHRAEIMQLHGDWVDALEEARRAGERLGGGVNRSALAQSHYRRGELHRLRGEYPRAEEAYREASRAGFEPQPGLALLRLAQGRTDAAAAASRRFVAESASPMRRASLLPAHVEILLAVDDLDGARAACAELVEIAERFGSVMLDAMVAHAQGAVRLVEGDAEGALAALRAALEGWQSLEAPYEGARSRVLVARACSALGDEDTAALELDAARATFAELGAEPDLTHARSLTQPSGDDHGLTARELEVLRLVAAGKSNREIAAELVISEHTVARHLQNIFGKIDVSSRTAAGAYAFEHDLV